MPLSTGTRLGSYEILAAIGSGGMGEVYRARDTKLGRAVAIKVILDEFASDEARVARFEREAKMLASLHHPRIAALFGMDRMDGQHFLVMELIEGQTLADRLAAVFPSWKASGDRTAPRRGWPTSEFPIPVRSCTFPAPLPVCPRTTCWLSATGPGPLNN